MKKYMKWHSDIDNKVLQLIKEGYNYKEISIIFETTPDTIRGRCHKLKIKSSDYKSCKKTPVKCECLECGKEFFDNERKFCSKSCSISFNNKIRIRVKKVRICLNCGVEMTSKYKIKYCSINCKNDYEYKVYIDKWKNGKIDGNTGKNKESLSHTIRRYIMEKFDNKCSICGWNKINEFTGKIPLEIDHIDGNHLNSKEENLRPLCPSCHSLTEFYGARNKGNGRKYRRK